jgi:hypothetical protein
MDQQFFEEREMERLQGMHETVERLRSQLRTIKLGSPAAESDVSAPSAGAIQHSPDNDSEPL